ncbi:metallophosphoesterase family protein [Paenibacillus thalictri]|uniref:Metallophosphoesterase n=1 Tax=Paenibacillus thalictri TaxID=2527873 RepID=A0A4V2J4U0_9BACL|nr:metallophosphoesterase [Paenibacillus thalictri]TBL81162.1 metallophosphoesterase [Paenibacillus thalictri]
MKLLVMGDFHYSRLEDPTADVLEVQEKLYSYMLKTFFEIEADYHISVGDFSNKGYPEELQYLVDKMKVYNGDLKRRFIQVLGNHDTITLPKQEILAITGQQLYHSIDTNEAILVFLDTAKEMNLRDAGGEVSEEQIAWLEDLVQKSGNKPMLIFAHHPVYATTARSELNMLSIHPDQDIWPILQRKQGSGYYFCGHNHVNSIVQRDHWHFIQTSSCLDIPAYRIIDINADKVSIDMVFLDEQFIPLAKQISPHMLHFRHIAEALGDKSDHSLVVNHIQ